MQVARAGARQTCNASRLQVELRHDESTRLTDTSICPSALIVPGEIKRPNSGEEWSRGILRSAPPATCTSNKSSCELSLRATISVLPEGCATIQSPAQILLGSPPLEGIYQTNPPAAK